jgi:hypothetical protein
MEVAVDNLLCTTVCPEPYYDFSFDTNGPILVKTTMDPAKLAKLQAAAAANRIGVLIAKITIVLTLTEIAVL